MKESIVTPLFERIGRKLGVRVEIEPNWRYTGRLVFPDGTFSYFLATRFDINPFGAAEVAGDKDYASFFMKKMGYPVPDGEAFFSPRWARTISSGRTPAAAYRYARTLGFPLIVKPNSLSQGVGVCVVHNKKEFDQAVKFICTQDKVFLVQRLSSGRDFRVVVVGGEILSAYERLPLAVVGDGVATIAKLVAKKQREFREQGRYTLIRLADFRITNFLRQQGLTRASIPKRGEQIKLLGTKNLSTGGESRDVTKKLHPTVRNLCIRLARDMGLNYCGVDLLLESAPSAPLGKYTVLEINAAPGIDHYAASGNRQRKIVERLYTKVFQALIKQHTAGTHAPSRVKNLDFSHEATYAIAVKR